MSETAQAVLIAVEDAWRERRSAPTVRQVMVQTGLRSTSATLHHLRTLARVGQLDEVGWPRRQYVPTLARCLVLLREAAGEQSRDLIEENAIVR